MKSTRSAQVKARAGSTPGSRSEQASTQPRRAAASVRHAAAIVRQSELAKAASDSGDHAAALRYAREVLGRSEIISVIRPGNVGSMRVASSPKVIGGASGPTSAGVSGCDAASARRRAMTSSRGALVVMCGAGGASVGSRRAPCA